MPQKSISQVLEDAAGIVAEGWCQNVYRNAGGCCASEAIRQARGTPTEITPPWIRLYVERVAGYRSIPKWNDAEGRTQSEVITALLKAAVLAAQEGH